MKTRKTKDQLAREWRAFLRECARETRARKLYHSRPRYARWSF